MSTSGPKLAKIGLEVKWIKMPLSVC
jgi:hypothetical protein